MKKQIPQYLMIFALVILIAIAIPSSFSKYAVTNTYTLSLSKTFATSEPEDDGTFFWNSWDCSAQTVTLPYAGRYAIIAKGGDGSNGYVANGENYSDYNIEGGIGGSVMAIYSTTEEKTKLYVAPGSQGTRPPKAEVSSSTNLAGGTNATGVFAGGSGAYVDSTAGLVSRLGSALSNNTQSGGGGAATIVCAGNTYSKSNIVLIAAGGGAAGCWNEGWESILGTVAAGTGGNGGSNVGTYATSSSSSVSDSIKGNVFSGSSGTGADYDFLRSSYSTYGKAGTTSGGARGTMAALKQWAIASDGNEAGSNFSSNGNGGKADNYGGGGGGGYCGGGGGTSTSIAYAAGGGGGGSSFIAESLTTGISNYTTMIEKAVANTTTGQDAYGNMHNKAIPTQYPAGDYTSEGDGYVIIMYLGPIEESEAEPKTISEILDLILDAVKGDSTNHTNANPGTAISALISSDEEVAAFLNARNWSVSGGSYVYFTEQKYTGNQRVTIWRYKDGDFEISSAYSTSSKYNSNYYSINGGVIKTGAIKSWSSQTSYTGS